MRIKVFDDVRIVAEPRFDRWDRATPESLEKAAKRWVADFMDFQRDHRSQDVVNFDVEMLYKDACSFCGSEWTEDSSDFNGGCCGKDMDSEPGVRLVEEG